MGTGKWRRIIFRLAGWSLGIPLATLLLFEIAYRGYWVDFYRAELAYFNSTEELENQASKPTLLILGDSYTAGNYTYAWHLKSLLEKDCRVINSGVSGTGIFQTNLLAKKRLDQFQPQTVIYQIYTGNDLFDLRYPLNWEELGPGRNLYWATANHLRGVAFLNYRLGQELRSATVPPQPNTKTESDESEPFSVENYSGREKLYLQAEPSLLAHSLLLKGKRKADFARLLEGLDELAAACHESGARLLILPIPHPAEMSDEALSQHRQLGGEFPASPPLTQAHLPFYENLKAHFSGTEAHLFLPKPQLQGLDSIHPLYFRHDPHLNPRGQTLLATLVLEYLKENELVPGS